MTNTFVSNDWMLRRLFAVAARGLPLARLPEVRRPRATPVLTGHDAESASKSTALRALREFRIVNRTAPKTAPFPAELPDARGDIVSHTLRRITDSSPLDRAIAEARDALIAQQNAKGYWLYELEADCTIPAEYIMMMHFLDEIDAALQAKIANYLRARQASTAAGRCITAATWIISCTVKAYYALKLAGDDARAPHMVQRARGDLAARRRGAHAMSSRASRWRCSASCRGAACRTFPWKSCCCRAGFHFHLDKVSYWSRTVMVPLFILCTRKPMAKNPRDVDIRELFTTPPEKERHYFRRAGAAGARRSWCSTTSAA